MRNWICAALALAACQQQPKSLAKPAEISFDGADVTDAAALVTHGERISWTLAVAAATARNSKAERSTSAMHPT
jgi:hypothetical protein